MFFNFLLSKFGQLEKQRLYGAPRSTYQVFFLANPGSPTSHFIHVAVKVFMCNNDMYKSLKTAGIWVRIDNTMSVIGCKQDTGSRHSVPVSTLQLFKLSKYHESYREVSQKPKQYKLV